MGSLDHNGKRATHTSGIVLSIERTAHRNVIVCFLSNRVAFHVINGLFSIHGIGDAGAMGIDVIADISIDIAFIPSHTIAAKGANGPKNNTENHQADENIGKGNRPPTTTGLFFFHI